MATLQRTTAGCVRWIEILVNLGIVNNIVSSTRMKMCMATLKRTTAGGHLQMHIKTP